MRQSIVITAVLAACATTVFIVAAMLFAGSETGLHFAWLVGSGSVWLADLVFSASVAWHLGQHVADRHAHPKMYISADPEPSVPMPYPGAIYRTAPRPTAGPVPAPGYVPMSQRPAEVTRIDLETWKPPVSPKEDKK